MSVQSDIEHLLQAHFAPQHLRVDNESHQHNVPPNSETHFKVELVSEQFSDLRKVARHQAVYRVLAEQLAGPVHALALHTYSPQEWLENTQGSPDSPRCRGGSSAEGVVK
jgi:BolA protein